MENMGFFEKIGKLFSISFSSVYFIFLFLLVILIAVAFVVSRKSEKYKKLFKRGMSIFTVLFLILLVVFYHQAIFDIVDAVIEKMFTVLYFPNVISYFCMLIISIFLILYSILDKKMSNLFKLCNLIAFLLIAFLFVLTLNFISVADVDLAERATYYSNVNIMILIQTSMFIFFIWILGIAIRLIINNVIKGFMPKESNIESDDKVISKYEENQKVLDEILSQSNNDEVLK